jgi:tyrosyl-tRNA synthetase
MLLQSIDFVELRRRFGCTVQTGGTDQWGNITVGVDLVRRVLDEQVFGLTVPLLTAADGTKLGKTERGPVWLDATLTPPFMLYQWCLNSGDREVGSLLRALTLLPPSAISGVLNQHQAHPERRDAQRLLARELTTLVHGERARTGAERLTEALFGAGRTADLGERDLEALAAGAPHVAVPRATIEGLSVPEAVHVAGLAHSRAHARSLVDAGAIKLFDLPAAELRRGELPRHARFGRYLVFQRGRKAFGTILIAD